ncbi:MAG: 1-acyl-sn-glycerol-3-phosphate acyltransferase [Acidimicrobiaceae bacterium]|nr:lysophospholipid acyltransferase family protein [Acidimicrobiaceae bacterium]MXW62177.1 1-acyl-sn-glycerol-3-phosphate acyltransferase [Acidimicrobiaceae bacterium]MYC43333.1 1-acyl-sn-glycerol-3-phosphate acyltransferase [Acidimicrobiaceae bacterium]MYH88423.1 1-acyl-sn-glycerol-3-phosphate acyltransferase [Acidimicrobiaceae bacterium]
MSRDQGQLQTAAKIVLRPVFSALWRITAVGLDNVPVDGPAILAPNHASVIDSFFLPATLPRRITFVGKSEYLDDWKTRRLFPALGMIPIDRGGGNASARALDTAARLLEDGELFGIYPEGTRARDGLLHKGHTGAARLAMRTGAPIIPVGILGTRAVQPPDAKAPKPFRPIEVRFGEPMHGAPGGAGADQRLRLRQFTDELMFEIGNLTGQDYVDEYATKGPAKSAERTQAGTDLEMLPRRSSTEVLKTTALAS